MYLWQDLIIIWIFSYSKARVHTNVEINTHTYTHTHTHIYIYIYVCVCVCVCVYSAIKDKILFCFFYVLKIRIEYTSHFDLKQLSLSFNCEFYVVFFFCFFYFPVSPRLFTDTSVCQVVRNLRREWTCIRAKLTYWFFTYHFFQP